MSNHIEKNNYSVEFKDSDQPHIEIKYIDSDYNDHFIIINDQDDFIINYLNGDINKLWKFLVDNDKKNQLMFNIDEFGKYYMIINEPIFLKYDLTKITPTETNDSRINQLVKENKKLIKSTEHLESKLSTLESKLSALEILYQKDKTDNLYNHFDRLINLNSYDIDSEMLYCNINNYCIRINTNNTNPLYTTNFNSLCLFPKLKELVLDSIGSSYSGYNKYRKNDFFNHYRGYEDALDQRFINPNDILHSYQTDLIGMNCICNSGKSNTQLFEPISKLKLTKLYIGHTYGIFDIDFTSSIHTLEEITIVACPDLKSVDGLFELPNLQKVTIRYCKKLDSVKERFKPNVHLTIS
jgi:hypothetical protein